MRMGHSSQSHHRDHSRKILNRDGYSRAAWGVSSIRPRLPNGDPPFNGEEWAVADNLRRAGRWLGLPDPVRDDIAFRILTGQLDQDPLRAILPDMRLNPVEDLS